MNTRGFGNLKMLLIPSDLCISSKWSYFPLDLNCLKHKQDLWLNCVGDWLAYLCFHCISPGLEFLHYFVFFLVVIFMYGENIVGGWSSESAQQFYGLKQNRKKWNHKKGHHELGVPPFGRQAHAKWTINWVKCPRLKDKTGQESILPSSMVTFPRKKYFPWPLESATPKLCRETKQTLKPMASTGIDLWVHFLFPMFTFPFHVL